MVEPILDGDYKDLSQDEFLNYIIDNFSDDIYRISYTYVKNKQVAEDLTQDSFIKAYTNFEKFNGDSNIRTWLFRIAINTCKDYLRSGYAKYIRLTDFVTKLSHGNKDKSPEQLFIEKDEINQLSKRILRLPVKSREILILYYFSEFTIKQISELLNKNENTIKSRLKRARELLKKESHKEEG